MSKLKTLSTLATFIVLSVTLVATPFILLHVHGSNAYKVGDFNYLSATGGILFVFLFLMVVSATPTPLDLKFKILTFPLAYIAGFLLMLAYYSVCWYSMGHYQMGDVPVIKSFVSMRDAFYFATITSTTTGYGDMLPCPEARLFASTQAITSHLYSVLAFSILITKWR